jgi:hypothetical protein
LLTSSSSSSLDHPSPSTVPHHTYSTCIHRPNQLPTIQFRLYHQLHPPYILCLTTFISFRMISATYLQVFIPIFIHITYLNIFK